jgi:hypothetical protein
LRARRPAPELSARAAGFQTQLLQKGARTPRAAPDQLSFPGLRERRGLDGSVAAPKEHRPPAAGVGFRQPPSHVARRFIDLAGRDRAQPEDDQPRAERLKATHKPALSLPRPGAP